MKKKSQRKKVFVEDWLSNPDLKDWVEKDKNNKANTWCFVCNKTLPLSTSGQSTLTDHANVRKHSKSVKKNTKFFYLCKEIDSITSSSSAQEGNNKQQTLDVHVHNADVVKAEVIWILRSICSGYSNSSCEQLNCTLKAMFPESKIAEAFSMGRTKSMYMN